MNEINKLDELVGTLRGEKGCPWDKKQTPKSMAVYLAEEVYELMEAIESGKPEAICEELGDVLFHVFFLARLFQEKGDFDIGDVARGITEKMIHRHPHVFGNDTVSSAEEVKARWRQIKLEEKNHVRQNSLLDSVPAKMPALMRAYRISERAAGTGFDWNDISGVMQKAEEEWFELKSELAENNQPENNKERVAMEFGDVLFTLANVARFAKIHPETALTASVAKFEKRFKYMEKIAAESGRRIEAVPQEEKETLWERAKEASDV
jgi:tetrapyrrole methylase family protein/MazG family protein